VALAALVLLLAVNLPLFLCMPLWPDVSFYDLCARNLLDGGVHYRDIFETNLPGMVWLHTLIRSLLGWSSVALRAVDLVIVVAAAWLLASWRRPGNHPRAVQVGTLVVLLGFYFSTSEACHCQRDVWMLLPALAALYLRRARVARMEGPDGSVARAALGALAEGACWGAAFWIKPHIAVPALAAWGLSAVLVARSAARPVRLLAADVAGTLAGGLLAGGLGVAWLWGTGAWPSFWEVFVEWNPEYFPRGNYLVRSVAPFLKPLPWGLVHLVALPLAVVTLARGLRQPAAGPTPGGGAPRPQALLAAFYLGWWVQAVYFQHPFEYVRAPLLLLGLAVAAGAQWPAWRARRAILAGFLALAAVLHPAAQAPRLGTWLRCLREGSTPQVRDRLALTPWVSWTDLDRVENYLRQQGLGSGDLACFDWKIVTVYGDLGLRPPTRFATNEELFWFHSQRPRILRALAASRPRLVVSDVMACGVPACRAAAVGPDGLPPAFPARLKAYFPWSEPIVFRAGRYAVHRMKGPLKRTWLVASPEAGR
jgi:hypothetical protein